MQMNLLTINDRPAVMKLLIILVVMVMGLGALAHAAAPTMEVQYPGLAQGVFKSAQLEVMDPEVLLQADGVTIHQTHLTDLTKLIRDQNPQMQSQLEKNLFFLLEQEATRRLLLSEAKKAGIESGKDETAAANALLAKRTQTVEVSEQEARSFYLDNKELFAGAPFEQVAENIRQYLFQGKKQQAVLDYIDRLGQETNLRINADWVKGQIVFARDNPVDQARSSGKPTLVEFGATGCVPCDMMQPILEQLRADFSAKLNVVFVHVGQEQLLAARFGVRSIPVQVFYDAHGNEVFRHTGFLPKDRVYHQVAQMGVVQ